MFGERGEDFVSERLEETLIRRVELVSEKEFINEGIDDGFKVVDDEFVPRRIIFC